MSGREMRWDDIAATVQDQIHQQAWDEALEKFNGWVPVGYVDSVCECDECKRRREETA